MDNTNSHGTGENVCHFDKLWNKNVPHLFEKIFLTLDYNSFRNSRGVNRAWRSLLSSQLYRKHGTLLAQEKLWTTVGLEHPWRVCTVNGKMLNHEISRSKDRICISFSTKTFHTDTKLRTLILKKGQAYATAAFRVDPRLRIYMYQESEAYTINIRLPETVQMFGENIVNMLADSGINPNAPTVTGRTILFYAASRKCQITIKILLDLGANVNQTDDSKKTPLMIAAMQGMNHNIQQLINRGADIAMADNTGKTALHFAARHGHENIVQFLLFVGSDPLAKDNAGNTAITLAQRKTPSPYSRQWRINRAERHENIIKMLSGRRPEKSTPKCGQQ